MGPPGIPIEMPASPRKHDTGNEPSDKPGGEAAAQHPLLTPRMQTLVHEAWEEAVYDMYNPGVPEPVISVSEEHAEAFYIDTRDWTVHLNLAHAPPLDEAGMRNFVRSISHHELGHYTICPYDGVTNALMFQAAQSVIGMDHAPIACNIVSDLIIEHGLVSRFKDLTKWRFQSTVKQLAANFEKEPPSSTWKVIALSLSKVLESPLPPDIEKAVDFKGVRKDVDTIMRMIRKNVQNMNAWPSLARGVAKILKKYMEQDFALYESSVPVDPSLNLRDVPGRDKILVKVPVDVLGQSGDVSKISDKDNGPMNAKAMKRTKGKKQGAGAGTGRGGGRDASQDRAGSGSPGDEQQPDEQQDPNADRVLVELAKASKGVGDFGGPAMAMGYIREEQVLRSWYRYRSAGLLEVDIKVKKQAGQLPAFPIEWRVGDPLESLDIALTLLNSPLLIPNLTTRRWEYQFQTGTSPAKTYPDFLIVIDSSGSMGWNPYTESAAWRGAYDVALVAAFAAIHFAKRKGVKLAGINFSGYHDEVPWTRKISDVEDLLLRYQGDGTVLPTKPIMNMVSKNASPTAIFIISDAGLNDWQGSVRPLMSLIQRRHHIIFFLIGGNPSDLAEDRFVEFMAMGGKMYAIRDVEQLVGLVVKEIQEMYGPPLPGQDAARPARSPAPGTASQAPPARHPAQASRRKSGK